MHASSCGVNVQGEKEEWDYCMGMAMSGREK
jgi:hypothetical protein